MRYAFHLVPPSLIIKKLRLENNYEGDCGLVALQITGNELKLDLVRLPMKRLLGSCSVTFHNRRQYYQGQPYACGFIHFAYGHYPSSKSLKLQSPLKGNMDYKTLMSL